MSTGNAYQVFASLFMNTFTSAYYVGLNDFSQVVYQRRKELTKKYGAYDNYLESINQFIHDEVFSDDQKQMYEAIKPEYIRERLKKEDHYSVNYRVVTEDDKLHHYRLQVIRGLDEDHAALGITDEEENVIKLRQMERERQLLVGLAADYKAIYRVDAPSGNYEISTLNYVGEDLRKILKSVPNYRDAMDMFIEGCVHQGDKQMMHEAFSNLEDILSKQNTYSKMFRRMFGTEVGFVEMYCVRLNPMDEPLKDFMIGFINKDNELQATLRQETILKECLAYVNSDMDCNDVIDALLVKVGQYFDVDRSYVFEINGGKTLLNNTYEYCAKGVVPQIEELQNVPIEVGQPWFDAFEKYGEVFINSVEDDLDHDSDLYKVLAPQDIQSLMALPIMGEYGTIGFIGLDNPKQRIEEKLVIRAASMLIHSEILQRKQNDEDHIILNKVAEFFETIYYADFESDYIHIYISNKEDSKRIQLSNIYSQVINDYIEACVAEKDKERLSRLCDPAHVMIRLGQQESFTFSFESIDGRDLELEFMRSNEEGTHAVVVGIDNSDLMRREKEIQNRLREAAVEAEAANNAKSDFLARMSHDIRTPINGVIGMTTIAQSHLNDPERINDCLSKIDTASHHLLSLVNDLLDMSRIESGKTEIISKPLNIRTFADNCSSIIGGQMNERGLELITEFENVEHADIMGDELHLRQVMINILGNALKFTPEGGKVWFNIKEKGFRDNKVSYEIQIRDSGIGMKQEFLEHIWEPFTQEDGGSRTTYKGTGLGMAITKNLVELMGGTIGVTSLIGEGSTFTINFEFEKAEKVVNDVDQVKKVSVEGAYILLVEDNELNMEIANEILSAAGANVTCAENGQQAIYSFLESEEGHFDAILMDIMMPIKDGLTASREIRDIDRSDAKTVPIIAMTANAFEEDIRKSKEAGMNDHISKPIQVPAMMQTLSLWIGRKKAAEGKE